jgi:hypothetical protein
MTVSAPVCGCALCSRERGEPNEAYWWKFLPDVIAAMPKPPDTVWWVHSIMMMFDQYDNERTEFVRDHLVRELRRLSECPNDISAFVAEMLDPASKMEWRLDLRRRRRPSKMSTDELHYLCFKYESRVDDLKEAGRAAPAKTALGELAAEYKMKDGELRAIIERAQGKRRRPKRRRG